MNLDIQQAMREHILTQYMKGKIPEGFDDDFNLIDEGIIDSLAMINLVAWLEKEYPIEFGDNDFLPEYFRSVNALAEFIQQKLIYHEVN